MRIITRTYKDGDKISRAIKFRETSMHCATVTNKGTVIDLPRVLTKGVADWVSAEISSEIYGYSAEPKAPVESFVKAAHSILYPPKA